MLENRGVGEHSVAVVASASVQRMRYAVKLICRAE